MISIHQDKLQELLREINHVEQSQKWTMKQHLHFQKAIRHIEKIFGA